MAGPRKDGDELAGVVHENIRALVEVRKQFARGRSLQEKVADAITGFAGSMAFVYFHIAFYGFWFTANTRLIPGLKPWDPFPFVMMAMIASVEAIFLTTFILISQNRMQAVAEKRNDLDLQINLLSEHEMTRSIELIERIARHLNVPNIPEVGELKKDVSPKSVLEEMEREEKKASGG
jgi:uncharacterized membrane protein